MGVESGLEDEREGEGGCLAWKEGKEGKVGCRTGGERRIVWLGELWLEGGIFSSE